jgi:hypothetical protein
MTLRDIRPLKLLPLGLAAGLAFAPMIASAQRDGTPGNPPGTAAGRAIDGATGNRTAPDGTPGNPPGTALGRAVDNLTGTRTTPDGTPGNPPGTAMDRAAGQAATTLPSATQPSAGMPPTALTPGAAALMRPRLSQLIGGNVYNERNERVGEVDDVILALPAGHAGAGTGPVAVIQVGGFLGMGGRLVTLPLGDLRWSPEREHIVMPGATRDNLGTRPAFEYTMLRAR